MSNTWVTAKRVLDESGNFAGCYKIILHFTEIIKTLNIVLLFVVFFILWIHNIRKLLLKSAGMLI